MAAATPARRTALWFFAGLLLLEVAWVLAVPPFRGVDEIDHAYRAASVAQGHWGASTEAAAHGRGGLVPVPADLVHAARRQCVALEYDGRDNCAPTHKAGKHELLAATSAQAYEPVYYEVVGLPAKSLHGAHRLYAMRLAALLMCTVLMGLAARCVALWARTGWPILGLVVATTPVAVYSMMLPAANGLEIAAAALLWAALTGVAVGPPELQRQLLLTAVVPAGLLAGLRQLGPIFLAAMVGVLVTVTGVQAAVQVVRRHRGPVVAGVVVSGAAAVAQLLWTTRSHGIAETEHTSGSPLVNGVAKAPLWFLQSIAAFPRRADAAPTLVYVCVGVAILGVLAAGVKVADARMRLGLGLLVVVTFAVPLGFTLATFSNLGPVWQGRYGLPLAMGGLVLAGAAIERAHGLGEPGPAIAVGALVLVAVGQVTSVVNLLHDERARPVSAGDPAWHQPTTVVVAVLAVAAVAMLSLATAQPTRATVTKPS